MYLKFDFYFKSSTRAIESIYYVLYAISVVFLLAFCAFVAISAAIDVDDAVLFFQRFVLFAFSNVEIINKEVASFDSSQYIAHRSCYVSDTMNPLKMCSSFQKKTVLWCKKKCTAMCKHFFPTIIASSICAVLTLTLPLIQYSNFYVIFCFFISFSLIHFECLLSFFGGRFQAITIQIDSFIFRSHLVSNSSFGSFSIVPYLTCILMEFLFLFLCIFVCLCLPFILFIEILSYIFLYR